MRTYPIHSAPIGLLTAADLAARGLRPGAHAPVAHATCMRGRKVAVVPLYDLLTAEPRPTAARAARRLIRKTLGALRAPSSEVTA
jgi:hypothetical protein